MAAFRSTVIQRALSAFAGLALVGVAACAPVGSRRADTGAGRADAGCREARRGDVSASRRADCRREADGCGDGRARRTRADGRADAHEGQIRAADRAARHHDRGRVFRTRERVFQG